MSVPTQAFPPWLSPSAVTVTQDGTVVVQTTVIQFPQTYYGPSIPLGTGWVFGGSTFPASIATSSSATVTPTTSQTTPTSSFTSSTPTSSFTSSTPTSSTMSTTTTSASVLPSSSSPITHASHGISNRDRVAIILSTIFGALLLAVLAIVLCQVRRRRHRHHALTRDGNFSSWQLVNPSAAHQPLAAAEEGEHSAFLAEGQGMQERSVGPIVSRELSKSSSHSMVIAAMSRDVSHSSDSGSGAAQNDASTLDSVARREAITQFNPSASTVATGSLFFDPARYMDQATEKRRSEEEEPVQDTFHPPRLLDPDGVGRFQNSQSSNGSKDSRFYPESPPSEADELATLLTAERVNVGSLAHPALASPPSGKSKDFTTTLDVESGNTLFEAVPSPSSWVGMGGLTGFAKGLGRLSWFRRMEEVAGPSGTHHSSHSSSHRGAGSKPGSRQGSRPASAVSFSAIAAGTRRYSGLLSPRFASRRQSGGSFSGIEAELGIRPPGIRVSGTGSGSGSGGSASGKSGGTIYHSASSRPQTPLYASSHHIHQEGELLHAPVTPVTLPPDVDLGEGNSTIRSVDVLDLPAPERALPLTQPLRNPEPAFRSDTASSRGTGLAFPPGLVAVPQWDRGSHSSSSNRREERDLLEDDPPQAGGEWSSLRSKRSSSDMGDEGDLLANRRRPVTRLSTGEQAVQVIVGDHAASETASFSSGLRRADPSSSSDPYRAAVGARFILTPSASVYTSSHSHLASHSGSGSHSSRPSQLTTSHSHEQSHQSSIQDVSEDGHLAPIGPGIHRASLSAIGGDGGPPQLPLFRALSPMQPTLEADDESSGSSSSSPSPSRPDTGTSRPSVSEATYTGTLASASTSVPTTVRSMTGSFEKW